MLSLLCEAGVKIAVSVHGGVDANYVTCAELADAGLEQVLLDRPSHQVVVDA